MTAGAQFAPTPSNMVQEVNNIIEGYRAGPNRALAQDPPQNSLDAATGKPVRSDYRLHERSMNGTRMTVLTVTDSNTTGLQGPALSTYDLASRAEETGYLELSPGENWAAFEAMGYTKEGEQNLGSRGQGKAAFLYHSAHPSGFSAGGRSLDQMAIMYDTLLDDGAYRLGVRLARPDDVRLEPPLEGDDARSAVTSRFRSHGLNIPLELSPLTEIGTRVIVPFLRPETVEAFESGEMYKWLQRVWWRAIQLGLLEVTLGWEAEEPEVVTVPTWWSDEPWKDPEAEQNIMVREDIPLEAGSPLKIKRIVLLYDEALESDEILQDNLVPEYAGVQAFRGAQWVETLGVSSQFNAYVPPERRAGFRGFVEFERRLDRSLREWEAPQHDRFDRRRGSTRLIDRRVEEAVQEFAQEMGWYSAASTTGEEDTSSERVLQSVAEMFYQSDGDGEDRPGQTEWTSELELVYPSTNSVRVNWGESVEAILASVKHEPADERKDVTARLMVVEPSGDSYEVDRASRVTSDGEAAVEFGDFPIVKVASNSRSAVFRQPGRYLLRAEWIHEGERVARSDRVLFVNEDPPPPPVRKPITVNLRVENLDRDAIKIENGDRLRIRLQIKNRGELDAALSVTGSAGDLLVWDDQPVQIPGTLAGDIPRFDSLEAEVAVATAEPNDPPAGPWVVLEPGRHRVRADVASEDTGEVVAHASVLIWVEAEPEEAGPDLPYRVKKRETAHPRHPVWELEPSVDEPWILYWSPIHPVYDAALRASQFRPHDAGPLHGLQGFWTTTHCEAIVELALSLHQEKGDEGGFAMLLEPEIEDVAVAEHYKNKLRELMNTDEPIASARLQREVVDVMIYMLVSTQR